MNPHYSAYTQQKPSAKELLRQTYFLSVIKVSKYVNWLYLPCQPNNSANRHFMALLNTDHLNSARRPDLMIVNEKKKEKKKRELAESKTLLSRLTTE